MTKLNTKRAEYFVQKSKFIMLSMDETPSSAGHKCYQIGGFNEKGEYCIFCFKEIEGGTSKEMHSRAIELLKSTLGNLWLPFVKKVRFICSDTARNQIKTNEMLISSFMVENGGHPVYIIKCALHSVSNMEKKAKATHDVVASVLNALSNGLGRRARPGYQVKNVHNLFKLSKLDSEQTFKPIMQQRGCRFYCDANNSMVYAENYEFINLFVDREKEDNDYCSDLNDAAAEHGAVKLAAIVGALGLVWSTAIAPIWSLISKPIKIKELKKLIMKMIFYICIKIVSKLRLL